MLKKAVITFATAVGLLGALWVFSFFGLLPAIIEDIAPALKAVSGK